MPSRNDPDRLARFKREAQVLASLNHPNIAAIYGVEERALVMELVEGRRGASRGPDVRSKTALPLIASDRSTRWKPRTKRASSIAI